MFDLPDAKRVRREDLKASDDSDWSEDDGLDADLRESLNARIARSLGLDLGQGKPLDQPQRAHAAKEELRQDAGAELSEDEDLGEFEFRLFSTTETTKVVLQSNNGPQGEGGLVSKRPLSHYQVTSIAAELKRQYEFAAVSGQEVLVRSRQRSWGLELPWRVIRATSAPNTTMAIRDAVSVSKGNEAWSRKRPGKSKRIALRKKDRARKEKEEIVAKQRMDKEEHLKDKKKRLNRAKKLRKRAKDKEKKLSVAAGAASDVAGSDSDVSD
ncbi:hypothetical protein HIM_00415 [Hirsutella minnesotensis 3608]|nr:hypothetical protein HIM_00415 [Hirsutella minnesotensis 3608]